MVFIQNAIQQWFFISKVSMAIESVIEFIQWYSKQDIDFYVGKNLFRGQLDSNWPLLPSIARYAKLVPTNYWEFHSVRNLEGSLIELFEKFAIPYKDYRSVPYFEKLVDAQHYGLPTRLLDWTTNPLKALFFAVEDPDMDSVSGIVYFLIPEGWLTNIKSLDENSGAKVYYPESFK